jgi:hypothetical protein
MNQLTIMMYLLIFCLSANLTLSDTDPANPAKVVKPCGLPTDMNCFENRKTAYAEEVNANFKALFDRYQSLTEIEVLNFKKQNTDWAKIYFQSFSDDFYQSNLVFETFDGGDEGFIFKTTGAEKLRIDNRGTYFRDHLILTSIDPYIRTERNDRHIVISGGSGWGETGGIIVARGAQEQFNPQGVDFWGGNKIGMVLDNNQNVTLYKNLIMNHNDPYIRTSSNDKYLIISGGSASTATGGVIVLRGANDPTNPHGIEMYTGDKSALVIYKDSNAIFRGKVTAQNILRSSDKRYKKNINPLQDSLYKALALKPVQFNWKTEAYKEKGFSTRQQIGLIANDVESIVPESVHTDKEGYKQIDYDTLSPVMIGAIQELNGKISNLENENKTLKKTNDYLFQKIAWLEKEMKKISTKNQTF